MLLAVPLGAAIGVTLGMLGAGGSVLVVPVLVYVFGETPRDATTGSLIVVAAAAVAAGLGQSRAGQVCWAHAGAFLVPALPAIYLGTVFGDLIGGDALLALFAAFMVAAAYAMWRRSEPSVEGREDGAGSCPPVRLLRDGALGALIGVITGLLGVGGGFLIVPALALALGLSVRTAVGTSLVIIASTGALGAAVHLLAGRSIEPGITALLGASMIAGAVLGVALGRRLPQATLGRAFSVVVSAVAVYLVVSVALLGGPPG